LGLDLGLPNGRGDPRASRLESAPTPILRCCSVPWRCHRSRSCRCTHLADGGFRHTGWRPCAPCTNEHGEPLEVASRAGRGGGAARCCVPLDRMLMLVPTHAPPPRAARALPPVLVIAGKTRHLVDTRDRWFAGYRKLFIRGLGRIRRQSRHLGSLVLKGALPVWADPMASSSPFLRSTGARFGGGPVDRSTMARNEPHVLCRRRCHRSGRRTPGCRSIQMRLAALATGHRG